MVVHIAMSDKSNSLDEDVDAHLHLRLLFYLLLNLIKVVPAYRFSIIHRGSSITGTENSFYLLAEKKLHYIQNVQESDTTGDESCYNAR